MNQLLPTIKPFFYLIVLLLFIISFLKFNAYKKETDIERKTDFLTDVIYAATAGIISLFVILFDQNIMKLISFIIFPFSVLFLGGLLYLIMRTFRFYLRKHLYGLLIKNAS
jgi:amino acid transporter